MTDLRSFEMAASREEERRKQPTLLDFEEEADKLRRIVEERRKVRETVKPNRQRYIRR